MTGAYATHMLTTILCCLMHALSLILVLQLVQGFVTIYTGRETRHRAKNLCHATEYEFRLKVIRNLTTALHAHHYPACRVVHTRLQVAVAMWAAHVSSHATIMIDMSRIPVMIDSVNQG